MHSQIKLGRIFGIRVGLHYSWFLIALLIVFSLVGSYRTNHPDWSFSFIVMLSLATAFLFFVSLLLHELSHSLVARSDGLPVREITLFALGGVSQIGGEATTAGVEFWIAIVGPLSSLLIGFLCLGTVDLVSRGPSLDPFMAVLSWIGYINLGLAFFNMIPGYPMDGGRVLRAILWWKSGSLDRATRYAAITGQAVAGAFIALGIIEFFRGTGLSGLWIAFIGWFLLHAARESYVETTLKSSLDGVKVGDLTAQDFPFADQDLTIQEFVDEMLLRTGRRCFLVVRNGQVVGLVTPHEIKHVDRTQWPVVRLSAVMRPLEKARTVTFETSLLRALEIMGQDDLNQLPVLSGGQVKGVLSREKILDYLRTRMELQGIRG
jgi:Zn-dependent protease/predicted transcriptional regulator